MRIALFSDIHANLPALEAFFADVETKNPDVFSGRVYTGDQGKQVGLVDEFGSVYSVSRDVFKAPEMVNYTPKDDFSTSFGRQFGMQMKSAADTLTLPSW